MSDRYTVLGNIASGGMGVVYLGRMAGSAGFSRLVAIKRLHRELAAERGLVAMLVDEARMASRIRHANVIDTLDLVVYDGAFSLVLEYVEGAALSALIKRAHDAGEKVPQSIALAIMYGVLRGLDAAHEARSDDGAPLGLVHRDVSPQNVLVGVDGIPRVIDFGVAKALGRLGSTQPGEVRGKYTYMAPEQLLSRPVTRQADVYSAGVVLWELLAHRKLFTGDDWRMILDNVLKGEVPNPSEVDPDVPLELGAIAKKSMARDLGARHLTAQEFLTDLKPFPRASDDEVGAWVRRLAAEELAKRHRLVQDHVPETSSQSVDELLQDLKRSRGHTPRRSKVEPPVTPVEPMTAEFSLLSQLDTLATAPSAQTTMPSNGMETVSTVSAKRRRAAIVAFGVALIVLATTGFRSRPTPPVVEASKRVEPSPVDSSLAATNAPPTMTSAVNTASSSAAIAASAPVIAPAAVRSETSGRRQKPGPVAAPYDPGNFR